jgi:hypothetical protein
MRGVRSVDVGDTEFSQDWKVPSRVVIHSVHCEGFETEMEAKIFGEKLTVESFGDCLVKMMSDNLGRIA